MSITAKSYPVEQGDIYKDAEGVPFIIEAYYPDTDSVHIKGIRPDSKVVRIISLEQLNSKFTKVQHAAGYQPVEIPKNHMDKIKAYNELIEHATRKMIDMLNEGLQQPTKVQVAAETLFVDDDDNIHVVFHEHPKARAIGARIEIIKELKKAQQI